MLQAIAAIIVASTTSGMSAPDAASWPAYALDNRLDPLCRETTIEGIEHNSVEESNPTEGAALRCELGIDDDPRCRLAAPVAPSTPAPSGRMLIKSTPAHLQAHATIHTPWCTYAGHPLLGGERSGFSRGLERPPR